MCKRKQHIKRNEGDKHRAGKFKLAPNKCEVATNWQGNSIRSDYRAYIANQCDSTLLGCNPRRFRRYRI